jgi:hypothetical protein
VKPSIEQIGSLLALRRNELPEDGHDGYWSDFLREFHHNQRQVSVKRSAVSEFGSRVSTWFSGLGPAKWACSAGLAYAAVMISFLVMPHEAAKPGIPTTPVNFQVTPLATPPPIEQLNRLDLSPSTQGSPGEQVF